MAKIVASKESTTYADGIRKIIAHCTKKRDTLRGQITEGGAVGEDAAVKSRSMSNDIANLERLAKKFDAGTYN